MVMKKSSVCAACKHQRHGCPPDCILRPYFPSEESTEFENAYRLFGFKKIVTILNNTPDHLRNDAATAIKFESNMRAKYPVHGCNQVIWDLAKKIELHNAELHHTLAQTAKFKSALAAASQIPTPLLNHNSFFPGDFVSGGDGDSDSQLLPPLTDNANHNYDDDTEFLAAQQTLDSLSGGGHYGNFAHETSTHAQQLPDSNNLYLPPLTENANPNYDNATEFLAAQQQQALPLDVPYPPNNDGQIQFHQTGGDQSVTDDLSSDEGHCGNFPSKKQKINHGQQVLPSFNDDFNKNYNDPNDFYSFYFPYPTNDEQIPGESAKYMPEDDDIGNPFS